MLMLDFNNLSSQSSHDSGLTLESTISLVAAGKDSPNIYNKNVPIIARGNTDDSPPSRSDENPYGMYEVLNESFSSSEGTANTTNTEELYNTFLSNVKDATSEESFHEDSIDVRNPSDDHSVESYDDERRDRFHEVSDDDDDDTYVEDDNFCLSYIFACGEHSSHYENSPSHDKDGLRNSTKKKKNKHRSERKSKSKKSQSHSKDEVPDDKEGRKERLKKKLASMDPQEARKFKKKLAMKKRERDANANKNVGKELKEKQADYAKKQEEKRQQRHREKQRERKKMKNRERRYS